METSKQIADRLREVFLNGVWVANTNFKDLLLKVNWKQATKRIGSLNTIAALTYHINYYVAGLLNVFDGGTLDIHDRYSFDLPLIQSDEDWQKLLSEFFSNAEKFADHTELMTEEKLDGDFVEKKYGTYRRNIEAMI